MTYDVVIVGSGAGGSTLAYTLAATGRTILILERGDYLARSKDNWNVRSVFVDEAYTTHEHWLDKNGRPFRPGNHYYVGGNTKFYGAALLRFRESDFSQTVHAGGISPAWPIGYADLEPYYTRAEHLYHVHGEHGIDPTPARRTRMRRSHTNRASRNWPPISNASVCIRSRSRSGSCSTNATAKPARASAATCDGFPCLVDAKADAHVVALRPALAHANVSLTTNAFVKRLETSASGRDVTDVVFERDGNEERVSGHIVVVA